MYASHKCWFLAEAVVQALGLECTENKAFALSSTEGEGPASDQAKWKALFEACYGKLPVSSGV